MFESVKTLVANCSFAKPFLTFNIYILKGMDNPCCLFFYCKFNPGSDVPGLLNGIFTKLSTYHSKPN